MADRSNGFADNFWGTVCRAMRDFINAFDVNPLALVAFLIICTCIMAFLHAIFDWFRVPDWWHGPSGVLFMITFVLLGKHTVGFYIASKHNSKPGESPTASEPAVPEKPPGGFAHLALILFLLVLSAGIIAVAHGETREEMKARLCIASGESAERVNQAFDFSREAYRTNEIYAAEIDALRKKLGLKPLCKGDDCSKEYPWLTNAKVREYEALEKFLTGGGTAAIIKDAVRAGCFDRLKDGKKGCYAARRAAGKESTWECYPLSPNEAPDCYEAAVLTPCSHHWIESARGTKFCELCGVYAIQHINGEWLLVPRGGKWIGAEPMDYPEDYGLK